LQTRLRLIDGIDSDVSHVAWPPVVSGARATLAGLVERLDRSQYFSPELLTQGQRRQLVALATHAAVHSPQFGARLSRAGLTPDDLGTAGGLEALPILTRRDLQGDPSEIDCAEIPPGHGKISSTSSSGSTGEPVSVRRTWLSGLFWHAQTIRWLAWSGGNPRGRLAVARWGIERDGAYPNWGAPVSTLLRTGPAWAVDVATDYDAIAAQIGAFDPHSLLTYPGVFAALLDRIEAGTLALPHLRDVRLLGEAVTDALRERAKSLARVSSCYSTAEIGYLTLECPSSGLHHIMSETAIVEVLGEDGHPAKEAEIGRVVATSLHNFATPLIRYEIGDWAEVGPACPCGRGLPTLARIHGRSRNRITAPDGRVRWPRTGSIRLGHLGIRQMQVIQHSRDRLEMRYTADAPLEAVPLAEAIAELRASTDPAFAVDVTFVQGRLDNPANGKFEEFVSKL
jgi:phenylacetate-CoA ligase